MPFNIGFETALVCIELCAQSGYFLKSLVFECLHIYEL